MVGLILILAEMGVVVLVGISMLWQEGLAEEPFFLS